MIHHAETWFNPVQQRPKIWTSYSYFTNAIWPRYRCDRGMYDKCVTWWVRAIVGRSPFILHSLNATTIQNRWHNDWLWKHDLKVLILIWRTKITMTNRREIIPDDFPWRLMMIWRSVAAINLNYEENKLRREQRYLSILITRSIITKIPRDERYTSIIQTLEGATILPHSRGGAGAPHNFVQGMMVNTACRVTFLPIQYF